MNDPIITVERRRVYVRLPYGHPATPAIKRLGAHWEPETKRWWLTSAKKPQVEAALAASAGKPNTADADREITVVGKATYKGRSYFVRWVGETQRGDHKARLVTLDGKLDFWTRCARPGHRPAADEACVTKTYQDERTLASIRHFVEDQRREEEQARAHAAQVRQAAQGEPTRQIANVTDERIIRAFFGARAVPYDYEVTQDQFDEEDNQGPGHYCGITVPASLADRWDAGITAARAAGHKDMRCREALLIRWRDMAQDEASQLPPELEEVAREKEDKEAAKRAQQEEATRKAAAEKTELEALLDGLVQSSVGPTAPQVVTPRIDGEPVPHHMATADPGSCTFGGEGMIRLVRGDVTYIEGRLPDGRRVVRQDVNGYDDWRTYYWAPADVARAWALAYAAQQGITLEQARAHLEHYAGCHGSDLYRAVVEAAEEAAERA